MAIAVAQRARKRIFLTFAARTIQSLREEIAGMV